MKLTDGKLTVEADAGLVLSAHAKAATVLNSVPANSDLTLTAVDYGVAGDDISIELVAPDVANGALSVEVFGGKHIVVTLATDGAKAVTSTATLVKAAIDGDTAAAALVTVAKEGTGAGVVSAKARVYLAGGADAVTAAKGDRLVPLEISGAAGAETIQVLPMLAPTNPAPDSDLHQVPASHQVRTQDYRAASELYTVVLATVVTACTPV